MHFLIHAENIAKIKERNKHVMIFDKRNCIYFIKSLSCDNDYTMFTWRPMNKIKWRRRAKSNQQMRCFWNWLYRFTLKWWRSFSIVNSFYFNPTVGRWFIDRWLSLSINVITSLDKINLTLGALKSVINWGIFWMLVDFFSLSKSSKIQAKILNCHFPGHFNESN